MSATAEWFPNLSDRPPIIEPEPDWTQGEQKKTDYQQSAESKVLETLAQYPAAIGEAAYYGIAGRFVRMVEPHTEADPSFLLLSFLACAGNVLGRDAYLSVGGDRHHGNIFVCAVGPTSTGRKGTAYSPVESFFHVVDEEWTKSVQSGLSSGEGLLWAVRDPIFKREKLKSEKGGNPAFEDTCIDPGVPDKRLLVRQSEFFGALQVMKRPGNTLSPTLRDAWDRGSLNSMVKNSPARATDAHISIIGNITKEELRRGMLNDEMDNGFANRFLWVCSRRSKLLPEGGDMEGVKASPEFLKLTGDFNRINTPGIAREGGCKVKVTGLVERDEEASDDWGRKGDTSKGAYAHLTRERDGMLGDCTARAAPYVLRLSLIYALLDVSKKIRREHQDAALEVWRYCEQSARFIFGDALGDPVAEEILGLLKSSPKGVTRTEINFHFSRNKQSGSITQALVYLTQRGLARSEKEPTNGRPVDRWFAIEKAGGQ